jgi:hypothetical protein
MTIHLAPDVKTEDLLPIEIETGMIGGTTVYRIVLCRKGGGILVMYDGDDAQRYVLPLDELARLALEITYRLKLELDTPQASPDLTGANPVPTGEATPIPSPHP